MCRIVIECVDQSGHLFSVNVQSENAIIAETVGGIVEAYRLAGIEVVSASRIEEMPIDLNLFQTPACQPAVAKRARHRFLPAMPAWPARLMTRAAAFGSLVLSVIGFDDGFSAANLAHHVSNLMPTLGHMIQAIA